MKVQFAALGLIASTALAVSRRMAVKSIGDLALVSAGMAMAAGSVVFATSMLTQDNHEPRVNGMQYLAIFAKPRGSSQPAPTPSSIAVATRDVAGAPVDMAPTGSIAHGAAAGTSVEGYRLVAAEAGMAWLSNGSEIRVVKPGEIAPGIGRVASVELRDGRWALLDETGAILLASDAPDTKRLGEGKDPFARRMIFGVGH
jgi:hypothetical protein